MEVVVQGFGSRLREMRVKRKLTQRQLADRIGVGQDVVSRHERGSMGVSAETLVAYADVLETTSDYLAGEAGESRRGATGKAAVRAVPPRPSSSFPKPLALLLNDGRCNPLTEDEMSALTRYLDDGQSAELDDLEIHLLAYRAERSLADDDAQKFRAAVARKRKALKQRQPDAPSVHATHEKKPETVR